MEQERQARLQEVAAIAVQQERATGLPAQVLVAQWALESNWGRRPVGNANYFGIKKAARHSRSCVVTTHEFINGKRAEAKLEFADFDSLADSCRDYAVLLSSGAPYRRAWEQFQKDKNADQLLRNIAKTYATDPQYERLASQIAVQREVVDALSAARKQ